MERISPRTRAASYSFLVTEHSAQHLILYQAQHVRSINVDKAELGLGQDLQAIKHKSGSEVIETVQEDSEKRDN